MGRGYKKNLGKYEGQQYRGGRSAGQKNLTRTSSGLIKNQHGITFTDAEKKDYQNLVNRVNYRRAKMLKEEATIPRKIGGKHTGDTVSSLRLMGQENEFIIAKRSKSLQRFSTREAFDAEMKKLGRIAADPERHVNDQIRMYKRNYIASLRNEFGSAADGVAMKVRMMKPDEFRKLAESDELVSIQYNYSNESKQGKLNQIRQALNMKPLDDEDFFVDDELPY